jgi:hypothetical protein
MLMLLNRADVLLLLCAAAARLSLGEAGVQVWALLLWLRLFALGGGFPIPIPVTTS